MSTMQGNVATSRPSTFFQAASGRWAGERFIAAMKAGRPLSATELRTCDTLRKDEWKAFDEALIEEGTIRLRGIADLVGAGLTINVPNALGKTIVEYEKVTDMEAAITSLDGLARGDSDRQTFELSSVPLPITHKDFNISIRTLTASRERGESLDTTQVRTAGRLVAERLEYMLFRGGPTYGAATIYGYTNHPDRNTGTFVTNGNWSAAAKTGENILEDTLTMKRGLEADRFYGPYWLYLPSAYSTVIDEDFKAASDKTIRERLLEVDGLERITVVDQLPANNLIMVQRTLDVTALVDGESLQTVQWDIYGGMAVAFKAFAIQIPLIRSDAEGRSGVYHMS
jgi:hypothetical protein